MSHGRFNPTVHGARGLFCLIVFVFHVVNSGLATFAVLEGSWLEHLLRTGKFGVELFFGISGIVIIGSLARAPSVGAFLFDRYARILPVLWATLALLVIMALPLGRALPPLPDLLANLLAPPPFFDVWLLHPAAWSLGYEFTFYALCALWALLRSPPWLRRAVIGSISVFLLACYPRALLMLAGVWIASGRERPAWVMRLARQPTLFLLLYLVTWRLLELRADDNTSVLSPLHLPFAEWLAIEPLLLASAALGAIALLGIEQGVGTLGRLLRTSALQWLGTVSYSFYLWHPLTLAVVKLGMRRLGLVESTGPYAQLTLALLALPPSLLVAHYSQIHLEVRVTRWLKSLRTRALQQRTSPAPWPPAAAELEAIARAGGLETSMSVASESTRRSE